MSEHQAGEQQQEEGPSEAAVILSRFKETFGDGSGGVEARRTAVTEELQVD